MKKNIFRWVIANSPAMHTLLFGIVLIGAFCLYSMRREMLPQFDLETITISVPYPGASPEEVEEGICQKIEEEVQGIDGIKKMSSIAVEGMGTVMLELETYVKDPQKVLNEVRNAVDRIPSFPALAENKTIALETFRDHAFMIGILAPEGISTEEFFADPENELKLRATAEKFRNVLLRKPDFKKIDINGEKDYQIDIEISEETLRKYNLTLQDIARIVRQQNIEIPGGTIRTASQEILIRGKAKRQTGYEIADIPILSTPDGLVLTVGDLGKVRDEFLDTTMISKINGRPGMVVTISKTAKEDTLRICESARRFVKEEAPLLLPEGYETFCFADMSEEISGIQAVLIKNGWQGMLIVFVTLALFLDLRLAFWVAAGVPLAMLGAGVILFGMDETMNIISMFAFIMVLGILVDDAIIIGESIYQHRQRGKSFAEAAVDGTAEVAGAVISSVVTTMIAFCPLLFIPGSMGQFVAILPFVVIVTLCFSLFDSLLLLPVHLAHGAESHENNAPQNDKEVRRMPLLFRAFFCLQKFFSYPFQRIHAASRFMNEKTDRLLQSFIRNVYLPILAACLRRPFVFLSAIVTAMLLAIGVVLGGFVKFVAFPPEDSFIIYADIVFPDGTPASVTMDAVKRIETALHDVEKEYIAHGKGAVHDSILSSVGPNEFGPSGGSNVGQVMINMLPLSKRNVPSIDVLNAWREKTGEIPGIESLKFASFAGMPAGEMIELKLLAATEDMDAMEKAVARIKEKLATYEGVYDISSDLRPGKFEYQLSVKERARSMGISNAELLDQIRPVYYGEEVMRLQRGRHEVKLMVRSPKEERNQLGSFEEIKYRLASGFGKDSEILEIPITELADVQVRRGYSAINRFEQLRCVTISADIDTHRANQTQIVEELRTDFVPKLLATEDFRGVDVLWEGQFETADETAKSLLLSSSLSVLVVFTILTFQFRSFFQPIIVMILIPFSFIGAVVGHYVMGLDFTLMSLFGLVALAGVVINDSIVLVDCINQTLKEGMPINEALIHAGTKRFRPVLLTSVTTIGAVAPLILENSFQTQSLAPMAVSLSFGLTFSTVVVLVMVPVLYRLYFRSIDLTRTVSAIKTA